MGTIKIYLLLPITYSCLPKIVHDLDAYLQIYLNHIYIWPITKCSLINCCHIAALSGVSTALNLFYIYVKTQGIDTNNFVYMNPVLTAVDTSV